jgi:hypothetical protein
VHNLVFLHGSQTIYSTNELQSEIILSTNKSECIALSMTMYEFLPLCQLVQVLYHHSLLSILAFLKPFLVSWRLKGFMKNASCMVLTYSNGTKPHIKHLSLKWHQFKEHIRKGNNTISNSLHTFHSSLQFLPARESLPGK